MTEAGSGVAAHGRDLAIAVRTIAQDLEVKRGETWEAVQITMDQWLTLADHANLVLLATGDTPLPEE